MKPLAVRTVVAIIVVSGVIAGLIAAVMFNAGLGPLNITPYLSVLFLAVTGGVWWFGRQVRRLKRKEPTRMTPMMAMRVAVASRASVLVGAGCFGALAAIGFVSVIRPSTSALQMAAMWAGLDAAAALLWMVVAFVVERWCVIDDDDSSEDHPGKAGSGAGRGKGTPSGSPA